MRPIQNTFKRSHARSKSNYSSLQDVVTLTSLATDLPQIPISHVRSLFLTIFVQLNDELLTLAVPLFPYACPFPETFFTFVTVLEYFLIASDRNPYR